MNVVAMRAKCDQYGTAAADYVDKLDGAGLERLQKIVDEMVHGQAVQLCSSSAQLIGCFAKYGLQLATVTIQERSLHPG